MILHVVLNNVSDLILDISWLKFLKISTVTYCLSILHLF